MTRGVYGLWPFFFFLDGSFWLAWRRLLRRSFRGGDARFCFFYFRIFFRVR